MSEPVLVDGASLSLEDVERVARGGARVRLAPEARERMEASRAVVERALEEGRAVYGVTTGFGRLSDTAIDAEDILSLQRNLLFSHAAGVGDPLDADVVRAMALLRANTLAGGHCGVRPVVCERLLEILDAGIRPRVPAQGSVGASGDLAPLAHLALLLIGEGEAWREAPGGSAGWVPAAAALADHGIEPIALEAKEGLSLVNGTQLMIAIGALTLLDAERLVEAAEVSGALSLEAMRGTRSALREEIHAARPHPGQVESAARLRSLLGETSEIGESHRDCGRVQDPYSIRCMPQVHGAVRDALAHVRSVLEVEANAATDNPLVFAGSDEADGAHAVVEAEAGGLIVSGGNFHGAPVAAALDHLAVVLTDLASISERRVAVLMDPEFSRLPPFLAEEPGLESGFMMLQVTAAALVSEAKGLAHPASVDTIPTSANKEDHVSMGAWAARKAAKVARNAERVVAIELLAAARGLDHLRPMRTSPPLEEAYATIRETAGAYADDRPASADVEPIAERIREGAFGRFPSGA